MLYGYETHTSATGCMLVLHPYITYMNNSLQNSSLKDFAYVTFVMQKSFSAFLFTWHLL